MAKKKKRRLKKWVKVTLWCILGLVAVLIANSIIKNVRPPKADKGKDKTEKVEEVPLPDTLRNNPSPRISKVNIGKSFNDVNDVQLSAAKKFGIKPIDSRSDVGKLPQSLVMLEDCDTFVVDSLRHSMPFLTPNAGKLLQDIGTAFRDSLSAKGLNPSRLVVTSVLRTKDDVKSLQNGNVNATSESTHCYGTTFDISYSRFGKVPVVDGHPADSVDNYTLHLILYEVMRDLKDKGRCYVKHEKKQTCLHITVRS